VQKAITAFISETAIEYRSSSIVSDHGGDGALRAGDRMPDLTLRNSTLLEDWTDGKPLALALDATDQEIQQVESGLQHARVLPLRASDFDDEGRRLLGTEGKLLIIRPDGYVRLSWFHFQALAVGSLCAAGRVEIVKQDASRQKRPSAARQRFLDAARKEFADKGYAGASIRSIARSLHMRESAFYAHFKSKQEAYDAILSEAGPDVMAVYAAQIDASRGPQAELTKLAQRAMKAWTSPEVRASTRHFAARHLHRGRQ